MKEIVDGGEVDECNRVSQQNVQRKQQDCERANLDHCESDNSESWSRELFLVLQVVKEMVEVAQDFGSRLKSSHFCFFCIFVRRAIPWSAEDGRISKFPTVGFSSFVGCDPSPSSGHELTTGSPSSHSVRLEVNVRQQKFPRSIRGRMGSDKPLYIQTSA